MQNLIIDEEFKNLISALTDDEFNQLEENILRDGIQDPLKIWNGILIDGNNRYSIAQKHNLEFSTVEMQFESRDDAVIWIIKNQFGRRNLTAYDRSLLALKLKPLIAAKAKVNSLANLKQNTECEKSCARSNIKVTPPVVDKRENRTDNQISKLANVSEDTIRKVEKIEEKATPEVKAALKSGDISINQAFNEIKKAEKAEKAQERAERKAYTLEKELPPDACQLFCADIRQGLPQIADNSVDFIITDPPYPKEFLPLYEDLSKVAARVLKDGGSLVCMVGQSYLPEVIQLLKTSMNYHWCMCYLTPGATPQLWQKRTNTFWKPLLWFVKGSYNGDWIGNDVMQSPGNDKRFHEWGQSIGGMKDIIERFTNPNDIVLDTFLGGGTTAVTAVMTGRKFIGVDIKQKCLDTTIERVKEAYYNK